MLLSLPQGLFSLSAWFLECVVFFFFFRCICSAMIGSFLPPTRPSPLDVLMVSQLLPLPRRPITITRHWPKDVHVELQALKSEIGCETKKINNNKMRGKHICKAKDPPMHSLQVLNSQEQRHPEGGGHLCLFQPNACLYMVHLSSSSHTCRTAPGLAAQWITPKLFPTCVWGTTASYLNFVSVCLFFLYIPPKTCNILYCVHLDLLLSIRRLDF